GRCGFDVREAARRAEADQLVRAIAERAHLRATTPAERDRLAGDLDRVPVLVAKLERTADEVGPVAVGGDRSHANGSRRRGNIALIIHSPTLPRDRLRDG